MNRLRTLMIQDLQIAGLSERTQEAYVRSVRKLAEHYGQAPDQLSEKQVREYFLFLKNDRRFASATLKMAFYGIRFFYTHTVPRVRLVSRRRPRHGWRERPPGCCRALTFW